MNNRRLRDRQPLTGHALRSPRATLSLMIPSAVLLVILVALILRSGFDGLYGQDPYAYFNYATGPLRGHLAALSSSPTPPFFWPPGYPLLVSLSASLVGAVPLAGQLVSLLAGALVPLLTGLLAYDLGDGDDQERAGTALIAAVLTAGVGQLWQSSVVVMTDTTALAAACLSAWAILRYRKGVRPALFWLGLASSAMAFAVLTRWAYALVAIPVAVYALVQIARREVRWALIHSLVASAAALLILAPILPSVFKLVMGTADPSTPFVGDFGVYRWHPMNALRRVFTTADGLLEYGLPNGLYYLLAPAHRYYFNPLVAAFLPIGLWGVLRRRPSRDCFLLLGWAAVIYLFHAGAPWQNFRFTLAYLPPLAILAATGFVVLINWLNDRWHPLPWLLLLAGLSLMVHGGLTLTQQFMERKAADLDTVGWVERQLPAGARLIAFELTLTLQHYSELEVVEMYHLDLPDLQTHLADPKPEYLLLDLPDVEHQWVGQPPHDNLEWLRQNTELVELGESQRYTLLEIRP